MTDREDVPCAVAADRAAWWSAQADLWRDVDDAERLLARCEEYAAYWAAREETAS